MKTIALAVKGKKIGRGSNRIKKENLNVCINQSKGFGGKGNTGGEVRRGGRVIEAIRSQTR